MKPILLLLLISLLSACDKSVSMNEAKRDIHLIQKEVFEGNIESYKELRTIYLDYPTQNFLYWGLLMANKHDYPEAYYDVYDVIVTSYVGETKNFKNLDKRTQEIVLNYLKIAAEKGRAKEELKIINSL